MMKAPVHKANDGMTLLEVLLAVAVFGIAAVALVKTIHMMGQMTVESRMIRQVEQGLESLIDEYGKVAVLQELDQEIKAGANGVSYRVTVAPVEDLRSLDGQVLQGFFRIVAAAKWRDGGQPMELTAETIRFAGAFLPVGGGGAPIPINQPPLAQ